MAERRMFARKVIESDSFYSLSNSAQNLYFHMCMYADDDGFVNNINYIIRGVGASSKDYQSLCDNGFLIPFDDGLVVITHWKVHNYIQKDRYRPTIYTEHAEKLERSKGDIYRLKV